MSKKQVKIFLVENFFRHPAPRHSFADNGPCANMVQSAILPAYQGQILIRHIILSQWCYVRQRTDPVQVSGLAT